MTDKEREELDERIAGVIENTCAHGDTEVAHSDADDIVITLLGDLGFRKTAEAWNAIDKWYA
jgi:hypothetical protein